MAAGSGTVVRTYRLRLFGYEVGSWEVDGEPADMVAAMREAIEQLADDTPEHTPDDTEDYTGSGTGSVCGSYADDPEPVMICDYEPERIVFPAHDVDMSHDRNTP